MYKALVLASSLAFPSAFAEESKKELPSLNFDEKVPSKLRAERYPKRYIVDMGPLEAKPDLYMEYYNIYYSGNAEENKDKEPKSDEESLRSIIRAYEIMDSVVKENPKWVDGLWTIASIAWQWGSSYQDEADLPKARDLFVKSKQYAERCLKIEPDNAVCKLFLGSAIGSIGTIDGVFASMRNAEDVERLWSEVTEADYDFFFYPGISMQGSVRYGLGIFYRLVPDIWLVDLLFGVRGSLTDSVTMHREGIGLDQTNECSELMLAASLVCKAEAKRSSPEGKEGFERLEQLIVNDKKNPTENITLRVCVKDAKKLLETPGNACGYTTSKQQDLDESQLEAAK